MHLVGFVIRMYHDAQSPERQTPYLFECDISLTSYRCTLYNLFLYTLPLLVALLYWKCATKNMLHSILFNLDILKSNGSSGRKF